MDSSWLWYRGKSIWSTLMLQIHHWWFLTQFQHSSAPPGSYVNWNFINEINYKELFSRKYLNILCEVVNIIIAFLPPCNTYYILRNKTSTNKLELRKDCNTCTCSQPSDFRAVSHRTFSNTTIVYSEMNYIAYQTIIYFSNVHVFMWSYLCTCSGNNNSSSTCVKLKW